MSEVVFDVSPVEVVIDQTLAEVVVTTGPAGPVGPAGTSGVVAATSPVTYDSGSQTVGFDQAANNTTNDGRYARLAAANAWTVGGHTITQTSTTTTQLTLSLATSQTSDIFKVKTAAGGDYTGVTAFGEFYIRTAGNASGAALHVGTGSTTKIGAVIRGAASQTANLQEWQNSAGSVGARVSAANEIFASALVLTNQSGRIGGLNGGGFLQIQKATSSAAPGVSDYARLFIVAGTTTGTLKLVVRAGTAGAETTILDNIPQS